MIIHARLNKNPCKTASLFKVYNQDVPWTQNELWSQNDIMKKTIYIKFKYVLLAVAQSRSLHHCQIKTASIELLPQGDWIRGIQSPSKSNMPIKGNG